MVRNVAKVLSGSDCETQNYNYDEDKEINTCKRIKKKIQNSKYQQESEDEIISTPETKLKLYENNHTSKAKKKLTKNMKLLWIIY